MNTTTTATNEARGRLAAMCARLYDAGTPKRERRDLSLEVAFLRAQLAGVRDPLGSMTNASANDEDESD